ncbi:hypothetical protein MMC15_001207 [Xylographa vitiligo]|nr:hypothetical protein [Xylographa vitiligo]
MKTSMRTAPRCALLVPTTTAPMQAPTAEGGSDCPQGCTLERQAMAVVEAMVVLGLEDLSVAVVEAIMGVRRGVSTGQAIRVFQASEEEEEEERCREVVVEDGEPGWEAEVEADRHGWAGEVWAGKGERVRVEAE